MTANLNIIKILLNFQNIIIYNFQRQNKAYSPYYFSLFIASK